MGKKSQKSTFAKDGQKGAEAQASINTDVSTAVSSFDSKSKKGSPQKNDIESLEASKIKNKNGSKKGQDESGPEKKKNFTFRGKNPYLCFKDEYFKQMLNEPSNTGGKKSHKDVMVEIG